MGSMKSITWLPTHPAMGWVSMNRCWNALEQQRLSAPPDDLQIKCPLALESVEQPGLGRMRRAWKRSVEYPLLVRSRPATDVYHVLDHSFADLLCWLPGRAKSIVTVHDVIPLLEPYGMSTAQQRRFRKRVSCVRRADRVICVSEFTRRTLLQEFDMEPAKVCVLANGAEFSMAPDADEPNPFPQTSGIKLLMVGSVLRRKNLRVIPPLIRELRRRGREVCLLRVGQKLPHEMAEEVRAALGSAGRLLESGLVPDQALQAAYSSADALLFPSTLEGFGLPILEAMAAGCPVVTSNAASLPEVGGDAVLYFSPHDAGQAAEACVRLMTEPGLREMLVRKGRERAAQYTWANHWKKLCDIYREVANA